MCCFMKKWWLKIVEKIFIVCGSKRKNKDATSAERPHAKNFIDTALDETYGSEGGEGDQWPQEKWCN